MVQLSAPLARKVFEVGEAKYGLMVGLFGAGALVGTLVSVVFGDRTRRSLMTIVGLLVFAGSQAVLGGAPGYAIALVGLFGMGVAYTLVAVAQNTSIQARVDESHRGRVLSIYLMALLAGVPLGALGGGALADAIGLRETIIGGAVALAIFAVVAVVFFDSMRALDTEEPVHGDALLTNQPKIAGAD